MTESKNSVATNDRVDNEQLFETVQIDVNDFAFLAKNTHCGK